ncbi:MAG: hypothetical protein AB7F50_01405 [Fimbriimonadaceae bacterium]
MKQTIFIALAVFASLCNAQAAESSLYEDLGGVHSIAAAVDAAYDLEAKDPVLLGNQQFKWLVENLPPAAVKFAVTNAIAAHTGGPQKDPYGNFASLQAWLAFTPEQEARAWELRMKGMSKAGIPTSAQKRLQAWVSAEVGKATAMMPQMEKFDDSMTLYARLGGIAPIAAVVDTFVNELAADPVVMANPKVVMSLTKGPATGPGIKYLVTEQLAAAAGGPFTYSGRDMKSSHASLMITGKEWDAAAAILVRVLDQYKVPKKEQAEILAVVGSTRGDIVKK